jgi:hypothetical protein
MITPAEFLTEFGEDQLPKLVGPWVTFNSHDPAWTRAELRSMRKQGIIELDEKNKQYRILAKALTFLPK